MGKNKSTHLLIVLVVAARALLVVTCEEVAWKYLQVVSNSKRLEVACKSDLSLQFWKQKLPSIMEVGVYDERFGKYEMQ